MIAKGDFPQTRLINMGYLHHPHHRSLTYSASKSQWVIGPSEEHSCYQLALEGQWQVNGTYFGLHLVNNTPGQLGISCSPLSHALHIAKFVGSAQGDWHGYPVAPWLSSRDRPSTNVLMAWLSAGFINPATVGKLKRGKRCSL